MQQCFASTSRDDSKRDCETFSEHFAQIPEKDSKSCSANSILVEPFVPFFETTKTPWHVIEQRYFTLNKERLEEELNTWKKANIDIALMEYRIRRIAAALEVEKDQRRALEDRIYARVSSTKNLEHFTV
eukprot:1217020-Ditylum_brightwellii.AAC.1